VKKALLKRVPERRGSDDYILLVDEVDYLFS
jgi:hypothetical protein